MCWQSQCSCLSSNEVRDAHLQKLDSSFCPIHLMSVHYILHLFYVSVWDCLAVIAVRLNIIRVITNYALKCGFVYLTSYRANCFIISEFGRFLDYLVLEYIWGIMAAVLYRACMLGSNWLYSDIELCVIKVKWMTEFAVGYALCQERTFSSQQLVLSWTLFCSFHTKNCYQRQKISFVISFPLVWNVWLNIV